MIKFDLSVSGTRHPNTDWARSAVPRQANHSHIMTEIFATKLCTNANIPCEFKNLLLQF